MMRHRLEDGNETSTLKQQKESADKRKRRELVRYAYIRLRFP